MSTRAIARTASPPMAASASTRSTTSIRWSAIPDDMSDEEGDAGRHRRHGHVRADRARRAGGRRGGVVSGPGPIGLLGVGGRQGDRRAPVILTGTRDNRPGDGRELGADSWSTSRREDPVEAVRRVDRRHGGRLRASNAPAQPTRSTRRLAWSTAAKVCLAAFPHEAAPVDVAHWCATTSISRHTRRGAERDAPGRGLHARRSVSMRGRSILIRSRSKTCRPRSMRAGERTWTRSRSWGKPKRRRRAESGRGIAARSGRGNSL